MVYYNNELDEYDAHYHHETVTHLAPHHHHPHGITKEHALPALGHAAAGAAGAGLANVVIYPLDLITTRLKVQQQVLDQRARMKWERRRLQKGKDRSRSSSASSSSSDDMPGKFSSRDRWEKEFEEDEVYDGVFDAAGKIYDKEGFGGFYHGVGWDTLGVVSSSFWYFVVYHLLRSQRIAILGPKQKGKTLPVLEELGIGIMAAGVSRFIASPLSIIVTRKQTSAMLYPHAKPPSIVDIYHDIMRESGVTGFWSGYTASLFLTINPSITFLLYEKVKPVIAEQRGTKLDGVDSFFLAAACKAIATTLTYPLMLAMTRAQLEGTGKEMEMEEMFHGAMHTSMDRGISDRGMPERSMKGEAHRGRSGRGKETMAKPQKVRLAKGIVDTLVEIVKKEGLGALYVGLGAELAKGFFSHGVTMLMKEAVHSNILKLYYFVLEMYEEYQHGGKRHAAHAMKGRIVHRDADSKPSRASTSAEHRSRSPHRNREIIREEQVFEERTTSHPREQSSWRQEEEIRYTAAPPPPPPPTPQQRVPHRSLAHPRTVFRVEKWMDHVAEEQSKERAMSQATVSTTQRAAQGIPRFSREPSIASGRTSLMVHPPRSIQTNLRDIKMTDGADWIEEASGEGGRYGLGGGHIGIGGAVRGGPGWWDDEKGRWGK